MKKSLAVGLGIFVLIIYSGSHLSAETLFGYNNSSGTLYAIDTDIPSATVVGVNPVVQVSGEIELAGNVIYLSETLDPPATAVLHLMNPATGQVTNSLPLVLPPNAVFTALELVGNTLYGGLSQIYGGGGISDLATINLVTGVVTTIGPTGLGAPLGGLAYNLDTNTMYAVTAGGSMANLATINLSTGAGTVVGPMNVGADNYGATALEFGLSGALYALPNPNPINPISGHLLLVNPATGAATDLGHLGDPASFGMNSLTAGPINPDIPTLSEWGMIILSILLAGIFFYYTRKQRVRADNRC